MNYSPASSPSERWGSILAVIVVAAGAVWVLWQATYS